MADPILGRAYPALITPGLRVLLDVDDRRHEAIVIEAEDAHARVFCVSCNSVRLAHSDRLLIDYADPHTRDRVCRALEAHYGVDGDRLNAGHPAHMLPWRRDPDPGVRAWKRLDYLEPRRVHALRAVADAVWGDHQNGTDGANESGSTAIGGDHLPGEVTRG